MVVMKRFGCWLLLGGLVLALAACEETDSISNPPDSDQSEAQSETPSPGEAAALLQDLNRRLKSSSRCDVDAPHLAASYAERVPNREVAACRFSNESPLVVYAVRSGQKTYERHFAYQRGPFYYLYGRNWIVIAYLLTPREALDVLREDFGAVG